MFAASAVQEVEARVMRVVFSTALDVPPALSLLFPLIHQHKRAELNLRAQLQQSCSRSIDSGAYRRVIREIMATFICHKTSLTPIAAQPTDNTIPFTN